MPTYPFQSRLLLDNYFYLKTMRESSDTQVFMKLMYISRKSADYKRQHNLMPQKCFDKVVENTKSSEEKKEETIALLKYAFKPINEPQNIEKIENEIERNIKYAIHLASQKPFKTTILTSNDKKNDYINNSHLKNVKSVVILSGEDAILLVNNYWEQVKRQD